MLAANGITAYLYPRLEPTPALSWATRYLGCGAGICVTASHNPAKYNGYKVYGADGCQITLEVADQVLKAIEQHDYFDSIRVMDYDAGVAAGLIQTIGDQCLSDFVDAVLALRPGNDVSRLKLVYTPLNGSGLEPVLMLLERMGIPAENITVVPEQRQPAADVLEYRLAGGAKFMVRPSGTEPKIKVYLSAVGKSEAEADAVNERMAQAAAEMMRA